MTLILELPEETETLLRQAAARAGRDIDEFIIDAATEKLLSLAEAGEKSGLGAEYVENLTRLELVDFRVVSGQKFISERDLARYEREARENPDKALAEMVGMNQLWGFYDG